MCTEVTNTTMFRDMGHKQTLEQASEMSALPTKADMRLAVQKCPLSAKSGRLTLCSGAVTDLAPKYGVHVAKRDSPLPNLVPENHTYTPDAFQ
jgi:hypothetical protein